MNEQIMMTRRHPPLHHLAYGIICHGDHELASLFQQKLNQLGATEIQPIYDARQQQQQQQNDEEREDALQQWTSAFLDGLRQREQTRPTKQQHPASAGCTNGMVDVEDMGQVAQKINLMNKKKLVKQHPRARPKRIIGLDPTTSRQKSSPTTQVTTHAAASSIDI
jgi:16S rRNA U1498 N3-methylase RsmE